MKKDFDFDSIGKQTPYVTPDCFFEEMQQKVMKRVAMEPCPSRQQLPAVSGRWGVWKRKGIALGAVAACLTVVLLVPAFFSTDESVLTSEQMVVEGSKSLETGYPWIMELSDEELVELVSFSENDIFLDKTFYDEF